MSKERDDGVDEGGTHSARDTDHTQHPESGERPTGRPRWAIAAVVAAVLVAGGGGAWWASATGGSSGSAGSGDDAGPPLRMDGPAPVAGSSSPTDGGGSAFHLTGSLPKGPQKAAVYAAAGAVSASDVQHLATLLGMSGAVRTEDGSWRVGAEAGASGPSLLVSKAAPGTWSYSADGTPATGARGGGAGTAPVSPAAAESAAAPLIKGLGLSGAKVDASVAAGSVRTVSVDPRIGGMPTHGWTMSLQIGADGRTSTGYGRLSDLAKGATYPVVSAATALKELNSTPVMHPGEGVMSCLTPVPSPSLRTSQGVGPKDTAPPCVPGSGTRQPTEVRGAAFGLAMEYVAGVQTLVPAWLFETAQPGTARTSVVAETAVDPHYITSGSGSVPPTTSTAPPPSVNPGGPIRPSAPASPPSGQTTRHVSVDSYTASGSTLTLAYEGGACDTYQASASASGSQVTVSVVATPKPKGTVCPMIIRTLTQKVTLAAPLGDRKVVDASTGQPVAGTER